MSAVLRGCIQLGAAPILNTAIELAPVDYVSGAIVEISRQPDSKGKVFHLSNLRVIESGDLVRWLNARGYPLRQVPFDDWLACLYSLGAELQNNALYPLLSTLFELNTEIGASTGSSIFELKVPRYDCTNTLAALEGTSIRCPAMDEKLFDIYLPYLVGESIQPLVRR
jgi:thioester reductase-like protein